MPGVPARSLRARLLVASGAVLAAFVVLTALAVSWSVHRRADAAREERLRGLVYGIIGATEIRLPESGGGPPRLVVRESALPESRLTRPTAGLYAEIVGNGGRILWRSSSTVERVPPTVPTPVGDWVYERVALEGGGGRRAVAVDRLQLQSVWELDDGEELPFVVHVVDDADASLATLRRFDRSLWVALSLVAAALLAVQVGVLGAALRPLARLRTDLEAIDDGRREAFGDGLPPELEPLARSIDTLVARERARHVRYRELLDDLAHSLKTPLAVLANLGEERGDERIEEPVARMRASIERHVERARGATTTRRVTSVPVAPLARRVAATMERLHAGDGRGGAGAPRVAVDVDAALALPMPEADLFEVLGNLVDNACKYGARRVRVFDEVDPVEGRRLVVEDDGRGLDGLDPAALLERGVRADRRVEGQGHGLAAVSDLLAAWGGSVRLEPGEGGGARAVVVLDASVGRTREAAPA